MANQNFDICKVATPITLCTVTVNT